MAYDDLAVRSPVLPPVTSATVTPSAPAPEPLASTVIPGVVPAPTDLFSAEPLVAPERPDLTGGGAVQVSHPTEGEDLPMRSDLEVRGPQGIKATFGGTASSQVRSDVESEDGYTTYTVTSDTSVTLKGNLKAGNVGFGAEHTEGVETTYQVRMSDEDYQRMLDGEIPPPDPFHPETLPEGASIVMNSEDYENTGFSASYRQIGVDSNVRQGEGTSVVIEAGEGNQISVTAGPTEAVENSWKLGLNFGLASAHIGNTTELDSWTLNTATFDLDTPEGRAAYNEFLVTGGFPEDNGPGVTDVARIQKVDYNSTSSLGGKLGPFEGSVELGSSSFNQVLTTFPDGTATQVTDFEFSNGIPGHLEQTFLPDGTEDLSQQRFTMTLEDVPESFAENVYEAFSGEFVDFEGDQDLDLTFTPEQAEELIARAEQYAENHTERTGVPWDQWSKSPSEEFIDDLIDAEDVAGVAEAFATAFTDDAAIIGILDLAYDDPDAGPLPGSIEVD